MNSFSYGRPVIAPRLGCMEEMLTEDCSIAYVPGNLEELKRALEHSPRLKDDSFRKAALQKAHQHNYKILSQIFLQEVLDL